MNFHETFYLLVFQMDAIVKVPKEHLDLVGCNRIICLLSSSIFDESLIEYITDLLGSLFN